MNETKIAVIIGSTRPGRVGKQVYGWYLDQVKDIPGVTFEEIDLAKINLPLLDEPIPPSAGKYMNGHTKEWSKLIDGFDAYVWITPEYNHTAPASLLNAISYLYKEWNRKPVALVSYGTMGGVRAAEHLRQVAGELQMVDIRPSVMIRQPWAMTDDTGNITSELIHGDPRAQIADLAWWSNALKAAKKKEFNISLQPKPAKLLKVT